MQLKLNFCSLLGLIKTLQNGAEMPKLLNGERDVEVSLLHLFRSDMWAKLKQWFIFKLNDFTLTQLRLTATDKVFS